MKLDYNFYARDDVVKVAKMLLGKFLVSDFEDLYTAGMIVETEAYAGVTDHASHAYNHRRTKRTVELISGIAKSSRAPALVSAMPGWTQNATDVF